MALLYGRAGRLTAQNGGFRRGQKEIYKSPRALMEGNHNMVHWSTGHAKVRTTPSRPASWANFSLLYPYPQVPTGMHGPTGIVWADVRCVWTYPDHF